MAREVGIIAGLLNSIKQSDEVIGILKQTLSDCFKKLYADKVPEVRLLIA